MKLVRCSIAHALSHPAYEPHVHVDYGCRALRGSSAYQLVSVGGAAKLVSVRGTNRQVASLGDFCGGKCILHELQPSTRAVRE